MIPLLKKEILAQQKNVFMYVLVAIIIVLFIVNGMYYSLKYTELLQYHDRANARRSYQLAFARFYYIPPSPLLFCCDNDEKQQTITFRPSLNGLQLYQDNNEKGNIFLTSGYSLDWTFIVQFICSLLMIVLSYDVISDELERKTLSLVGSYSLSRFKIFAGKFFSIFLLSMIILAAAMLSGLITILIMGTIPITTEVITEISIFYLFSLIYCALFIFIGMSTSITMRSSAISLMVSIFIWIFLLIIISKGAGIFVTKYILNQSEYERAIKYDNLMVDYQAKLNDILQEAQKLSAIPENEKESFIENIKMLMSDNVNKKIELEYRYADEILQNNLDGYNIERQWKNISPAILFRDIIEYIFQCGNAYFLDYIEQMRFFTSRFREDMYRRHHSYADYFQIERMMVQDNGNTVMIKTDVPDYKYNNMEFKYKKAGIVESLNAAIRRVILLILLTITVGIWGFIWFVRCDIR